MVLTKDRNSEKRQKKVSKSTEHTKVSVTQDDLKSGLGSIKEKNPKNKSHKEKKKPAKIEKYQQQGVFKRGTVLIDRYEVNKMVSFGGWSEVYIALDQVSRQLVAIKVDIKEIKRLKLEFQALAELRAMPEIPEILAFGSYFDRGFIVMQLVGRSLMELRCARKDRKFTHSTLFRISKKIVNALQGVHQTGWVHRDMKPANCCIGRLDSSLIYLLDFGIARQCRDAHGLLRKPRKNAPFRGTVKYASLAVHQKKEQGPYTDLQSVVYSIVEMGVGKLPWSSPKSKLEEFQVMNMKRDITTKQLCAALPQTFFSLAKYIFGLSYDDEPDYTKIQNLLDKCLPNGVNPNDWFDWETPENR